MGENKVDRVCSHYDWLARVSTSARRKSLGNDVDFGDVDGLSVGGRSCGTRYSCRVTACKVTGMLSRAAKALWSHLSHRP